MMGWWAVDNVDSRNNTPAHIAHSPDYDDGGPLFGKQVALFSIDKNSRPLPRHNAFSKAQGLDDKFVLLFAGNVGMYQGLEKVLDTAHLLEDREDILFLIVGDGTAKPGLQDYAEELGLENVRFLPFQPREDLPEMYASSDVCLVPLRKGVATDSVPSKLLTITAAGRPLIASVDEDSDTYRFVEKAECGLWVEPENPDALTLYHDPDRRERLGRNGRAYVEARYTPQVVARQYASLDGWGEQGSGGARAFSRVVS